MCKRKVNAMFGGRRTVPLRTILQKCLAHIDSLEASRSVCDYYEKEFQELKQFSESLKSQPEFACTEGEKEFNRKKNRYKDILPFNASRVILSEVDGLEGSNYINANYIKGASRSPAYIASQGPLPNTINDFWRMIVECEVQVIVMACNAEEAGKHKCENYWVEREGELRSFGKVEITLLKAKSICPDFLVRTMRLQYKNHRGVTEKRTMYQFHYSAWPDHGVPPLVRPLLDMVRLVRDTQASETLPVLVHCSAGCGRTGTICAIDFVWGLLRLGKLSEDFSLYNLVRDMRMQRVAMVQTKEQYMLVHQAVRELFKEQMKIIDSHIYENLSKTGQPIFQDAKDPIYETLLLPNNCDEKQDETKGDKLNLPSLDFSHKNALPLPKKKYPSVACSKLEKEVENLTEKNRIANSMKDAYVEESGNSLNRKPKITKLKALFERGAVSTEKNCVKPKSSITRCHSMGPIRRPVTVEAVMLTKNEPPIQNAGKLRVPKLTASARPVTQVKRSKSLKMAKEPVQLLSLLQCPADDTFPNNESAVEKQRVTQLTKVTSNNGTGEGIYDSSRSEHKLDSRRRRSLESLIGESPPEISWPNTMGKVENQRSFETPKAKPHLSFKHQLQLLSSASQRTMNSLASGLGIRERRNSFRQAVNKEETVDRVSLQFGSEGRFVSVPEDGDTSVLVNAAIRPEKKMLTVRTQNGEILRPKHQQYSYEPHNVISAAQNTPKLDSKNFSLRSNQVRRQPSANTKEIKISSQSMRLPSKNRFLFKLKTELQSNTENTDEKEENASFDHIKLYSPKRTSVNSTPDVVDGKSRTLPSSSSKFYVNDQSFKQSNDRKLHTPSPEKVKQALKRSPAIGPEYIDLKDTTTRYTVSKNEPPLRRSVGSKTPPFLFNDDLYTIYNSRLNSGPQFIRIGKSSSASSQSSDNLSDYQKKSILPDDGKNSLKKIMKPHSDFCRLAGDRLRQDLSSESSSSSGARELNTVMSVHKNYKTSNTDHGDLAWNLVTRRKSASATSQLLSRQDPVAPPRARRRSEKLSFEGKHSSPDPLTRSNSNSANTSYIESNEWHGAPGVDLDTVAASLHRESYSGAAGAMRTIPSDSEKDFFAAVPSNLRKQQYL